MKQELELKYLTKGNIKKPILDLFKSKNYIIKMISTKKNFDEYFDNKDLDLYNQGYSLRIRSTIINENNSLNGTYKIPSPKNTIYANRIEFETKLTTQNINFFINLIKKTKNLFTFTNISTTPILTLENNRTDYILANKTAEICLSFDQITYTNQLNLNKHSEQMLEIEILNTINPKQTLTTINHFLTQKINNLNLIKESKYKRGLQKTQKPL